MHGKSPSVFGCSLIESLAPKVAVGGFLEKDFVFPRLLFYYNSIIEVNTKAIIKVLL